MTGIHQAYCELSLALKREAESAYPTECAGLIASSDAGNLLIFSSPTELNAVGRFSIPAKLYWQLRSHNADLLAIYHSHPSGSSELSATDLESMLIHGQPSYPRISWLVIPCANGTAGEPTNYTWSAESHRFRRESLSNLAKSIKTPNDELSVKVIRPA